MRLGTVTKQPADFLDYDIDFSDWLVGTDLIAELDVVVTRDDGLSLGAGDLDPRYIINNQTVAKLWLADGVDGEGYKIEITMTTDDGRVKQVELRVRVRDT